MHETTDAQGRDIPEGVKREVRRRCGFGCILCGQPLYHYHHEPSFAESRRHDADGLFLLCAMHHDQRTRGMLPAQTVLSAGKSPFNSVRGASSPLRLLYEGRECAIQLGTTRFSGLLGQGADALRPVVIDGIAPLSFESDTGNLLLSLELHDEQGKRLLTVRASELTYSAQSWDVRWEGQRLSIRADEGKYSADLRFDPPHGLCIERGRFLVNGVQLLVHRDRIVLANEGPPQLTVMNTSFELARGCVGLAIGDGPSGQRCVIRCPAPTRGAYDQERVAAWLSGR